LSASGVASLPEAALRNSTLVSVSLNSRPGAKSRCGWIWQLFNSLWQHYDGQHTIRVVDHIPVCIGLPVYVWDELLSADVFISPQLPRGRQPA